MGVTAKGFRFPEGNQPPAIKEYFQNLANDVDSYLSSPYGKVYKVTGLNLNNNWNVLGWTTNVEQTGGTFWALGAPTRFVLPKIGEWRVKVKVTFGQFSTTANHVIALTKNGSGVVDPTSVPGIALDFAEAPKTNLYRKAAVIDIDVRVAAVTDYVEVCAFQNSGSAQANGLIRPSSSLANLSGEDANANFISARWVRP